MANLLCLVQSRIRHAMACRILVFQHYTTCPGDCAYGLLPLDSIFYQLVLCGCTRSTYWALLPPLYSTRLCKYKGTNLLCKTSHYHLPTPPTVCLQVSVTLCAIVRFTCLNRHKVPEGLPSYTLRTGSGRQASRDVYGVIGCVQSITVFGVGMQQPRRLVVTRCPDGVAGGGGVVFFLRSLCVSR